MEENFAPVNFSNEKPDIREVLLRLEGVAEGLKPFFPKLGQYIQQCVWQLEKTVPFKKKNIPEIKEASLSNLSNEPKTGWEEIDRQIGQELKEEKLTKRKYKRRSIKSKINYDFKG